MLGPITSRAIHFYRAMLRPAYSWLVAGALTMTGLAAWLRDEFLDPTTAAKWKIPTLLPHWATEWWVIAFLITALLVLFEGSFRVAEELANAKGDSNAPATQNTQHHAIQIEFQPTEPFLRRTVYPAGNARFHAYVKIKNCGDGFLSECIISLVDITPKPANNPYTALSPLISLAKAEHRYIEIAGFNEVPNSSGQKVYNDLVTFAFMHGGGFFSSGPTTLPPPSETAPAFITIEVKALECETERKQFKLWVGDNRKLLMAQA